MEQEKDYTDRLTRDLLLLETLTDFNEAKEQIEILREVVKSLMEFESHSTSLIYTNEEGQRLQVLVTTKGEVMYSQTKDEFKYIF